MRVTILLLLGAVALPLRAQDSSSAAAASKGVYSAAQAERGEKSFGKLCIECHESFEFRGRQFDRAWVGKTAFDFFNLVKTSMPDDKPGSLKSEDVLDVLAYILKLNSYPAGNADLPNEDARLRQIHIDARPAASTPPAPARPQR